MYDGVMGVMSITDVQMGVDVSTGVPARPVTHTPTLTPTLTHPNPSPPSPTQQDGKTVFQPGLTPTCIHSHTIPTI